MNHLSRLTACSRARGVAALGVWWTGIPGEPSAVGQRLLLSSQVKVGGSCSVKVSMPQRKGQLRGRRSTELLMLTSKALQGLTRWLAASGESSA